MARSSTVGTAVFAVILTGWGVLDIIFAATGWAPPSGGLDATGAGLLAAGGLVASRLRRVTWADEAGLRLRGMFRTRVVPWSHVRYIHAGPNRGTQSAADPRIRPGRNHRHWVVQAGLVDGTVKLPGTDRAWLLCSSAFTLAPGDSARAVIIPLTDADLSQWRLLGPGARLRLFEGSRVCGHAVVRWSERHPPPRSQHRHRPVQHLGQLPR